jgi:hypothetical protein
MASDPSVASTPTVGRIVGALVLLHIGGALMLPYILLDQVLVSPGFLESAARNPGYLRAPALLFLLGAAVTLGISIAVYPLLRQSSHRLALCCLALGIANFPLQVVESGMVLSMLSLGQQYAGAGAADGGMLQVVAAAAVRARRWVHYTQLFTVVSWIFVLYGALWRAGLIPRVLAVVGLVTCALQITGVPLRALVGYPVVMAFAVPLGPAYAGLGLWLIVKGFGERREAALDRAVQGLPVQIPRP